MAYYDFSQTSVWKKAFELMLKVYQLSRDFPKSEMFVLTSDMRRAANSICHNFAEGFGRLEVRDKTRFYKIARASAYEVISQSLASNALGYISDEDCNDLVAGYKKVIAEFDNLVITLEGQRRRNKLLRRS